MYSCILWFSYQHTTKTGSLSSVDIFPNIYKCLFMFLLLIFCHKTAVCLCKIEIRKCRPIASVTSHDVGYPTFVSYNFFEVFGIGQCVGNQYSHVHVTFKASESCGLAACQLCEASFISHCTGNYVLVTGKTCLICKRHLSYT